MSNKNISCSRILPLTGMLNESPLLNGLHKSSKLELPEIQDHRKALGNIFNRLGLPEVVKQSVINEPKLNSKILNEIAHNFFSSSYPSKSQELIHTMSMPSYNFNQKIENESNINQQISPIQQKIIEEIKSLNSTAPTQSYQSEPSQNEQTNGQDFNNFF
ncbi:hypothetical protein [Acinetobacter sp. Marseille-Q1618]|uniref:hypothetical protein n=1 Tax=Acinetobacter sp. Marseille-Q1618 TaxID=2697502 RepID=UPI0020C1C053|nr:hypothetical protein [Acinetobacter sp. Marseille-Q1618]